MTLQHPMNPPPELVEQLRKSSGTWLDQITNAYQAGADQELEACVNYIDNNMSGNKAREFRAIRRPKPPSLKEEALKALTAINSNFHVYEPDASVIRRALEALDD